MTSRKPSPGWNAASGSTATRTSRKATSSSPTRSNRPNPTRPLKVGFQLPEVERLVRWPEIVAMTRLGEQVGFDSVWVGDHLLYRDEANGARGPWEAWTTLAGIAARTSRIAIGPLVACTSLHNPTMLAKLAGTVDEISGGRLILGLGAGWNETEYRAYGFPFDRRVARFAEAFTIIRSLLRDGKVLRRRVLLGSRLRARATAASRRTSVDGRVHRRADAGADDAPRRQLECLVQLDGQPARGRRAAASQGRRRLHGGWTQAKRCGADGRGPGQV